MSTELPEAEVLAEYPMNEERWHELRKKGVGGSDAGIIMGYSKYESPLSLWMLKTGRSEPTEAGEAAEMGTWLEPLIRGELVKPFLVQNGYAREVFVHRPDAMYRNVSRPWMQANVDGFLRTKGGASGWFLHGLEIKTGNAYQLRHWGGVDGDEVPDTYYAQVQHYMAVTGLDEWWIFGVIGNRRLVRIVPRNEDFIERLTEAEADFWQRVESGDPLQAPMPAGTEADMDALMQLGSPQTDDAVDLTDVSGLIHAYYELGEDIKAKKENREQIKQRIIATLGEAKYGETDTYRVTFTRYETTSFDKKQLKKDYPDIAGQYETSKEAGRLTVKGR
jgi:putative phage-type endonuclease